MTISLATLHGANAYEMYELYCNVVQKTTGLARQQNEISHEYIAHCIKQTELSGIGYVARESIHQRLVGTIHGWSEPIFAFHKTLSHVTICVDPHWQGQGIGSRLLQNMQSGAREKGLHRIELFVRESNAPAQVLYEKHGFVREGTLSQRLTLQNGSFENDLLYGWTNHIT